MSQPDYKIYITLLDAFDWYVRSESENAEQEFLDKVNRVPFTSEAAERGTRFNETIDSLLSGQEAKAEFRADVLENVLNCLSGAIPQYYTSRLLQTSKGLVEVYGYIDYIKFDKAIDLKTTKNYELGKYANSWQKIAYPYCLADQGLFVDEFEFLVTDFEHVYHEPYPVDLLCCEGDLIQHCERLIDFLEAKRLFITDRKIFNLEPDVMLAEYNPDLMAAIIEKA